MNLVLIILSTVIALVPRLRFQTGSPSRLNANKNDDSMPKSNTLTVRWYDIQILL